MKFIDTIIGMPPKKSKKSKQTRFSKTLSKKIIAIVPKKKPKKKQTNKQQKHLKRDNDIKTERVKRRFQLMKELSADVKTKPTDSKGYQPITSLIPQKIESKSAKLPINEFMEAEIICKHPASYIFVGRSGSGKSTVLVWMVNNLLREFFDRVVIISGTGSTDDLFKQIITKKIEIVSNDLLNKTKQLVNRRKAECESRGVSKCPKLLVIFEDVSSQKKLMASEEFMQAYVQLRHLGASVISCSHKLKSVPRMARISANGLVLFPSNQSETKQIIEDYSPSELTHKEFEQLIQYAWKPTEEFQRPFLFINSCLKAEIRFRKGFSELLRLRAH